MFIATSLRSLSLSHRRSVRSRGPRADTVKRGLKWLADAQDKDGSWAATAAFTDFDDGICRAGAPDGSSTPKEAGTPRMCAKRSRG